MKTPEAKEKEKLVTYLDSIGCFHFAPNTGGYGRSGVPDRIACINGRFVGLEVKAPGKQPTVAQIRCMEEIYKNAGLPVWGTAEEIINFLEKFHARIVSRP